MSDLRILAVVAHPADSFDMIGGTLANHIDDGDEVVLAIMESADSLNLMSLADETANGPVSSQDIARGQEAHADDVRKACDLLGLRDVRFLSHEGEHLVYSSRVVATVADLIQEVKPHIAITHNPLEDGGACDHAVCGKSVIEALYLAEGARPSGTSHHVGQICFMCWPGVTTWLDSVAARRYGAVQVDITRQVENKVRAYAMLRSHYMTLDTAAKYTEGICGAPGIHTRVPYVETYQPYRPEVYDTLPISDHNLRLTDASWEEALSTRLIAPYIDGVRGDARRDV